MIVDPHSNKSMTTDVPRENPPSYDVATDDGNDHPPASVTQPAHNLDVKRPIEETPLQLHGAIVGPSYTMQPGYTSQPVVHHYVNPTTGEQAGQHVPQTNFGILGILAAVFWFPLGIGLCLLDRRVKCTRCGAMLNDGLCS
ncbi:putative uncharacterized conserved protein (DUF2367) [Lyophyllum shimeji]|uniref:Uncharacterized conserved protein (DUF2367) n=1 Tax=Lyophyllum shimeji TaxID=47721 RepID=A0A9P3PIS1_LYOSH|nr:putative uncharacterized conserved protein (DUF2367) [Lyophyllum shimeji]